jgi:pSer/pThr/pTyr-binding forkhead associated (FHA) protein
VSRGQASRPALPLVRPVLTLGRSSDCDLILSDAQVSRHHAQIRRQDSGAVLVDLASSNGTFVNGRRIDAAYRLRPGDVLRLGNTQLLFELPGQPRRPAAGGGQLTLVRGKSEPANLALRPGVDVQIGRSRTNDVVIQDDPHVSRQHVRIRWTAQGAELLDLDSGAGVFVNGQQVKRARLQPGDRIRLSSTEFIFRGL